MLSSFSPVQLFRDSMDCSPPGSLSMGFSQQEYWSGLPCPPPGDFPDPGIKPMSSVAPALQAGPLLTSHQKPYAGAEGTKTSPSLSSISPPLSAPLTFYHRVTSVVTSRGPKFLWNL